MREITRLDDLRQVEMADREPRHERFQLPPPLGPRQQAQVVAVDAEQVVDAHEGGIVGEHPFRHRLAPEPLLERVEAGGAALDPALRLAAYQQFAVDHRILVEGGEQFRKGGADILSAAAVEARLGAAPAAAARDLDADTVPFPFGGKGGEIDRLALVERVREHEGAKEGDVGEIGPGGAPLAPREKRRIGRRDRVPQLLDVIDRHIERLREGLLREPRRHPDPHPAERQLEQRIAPVGVEAVEQRSKDRGRIAARRGRQGVDGSGNADVALFP